MRICYFGTYEHKYPRNSVLINGLKKAGAYVVECHMPLWEKKEDKTRLSFFDKASLAAKLPFIYMGLISKFKKLSRAGKFDYIVVGYIGQIDMFIARMIAKRQKIIFNPMVSLYDTLINDRKMFKNFFIKKILHWLDRKSCGKADLVLLDTDEHADYFRKEFGLDNVSTLYVGAEEIFDPKRIKAKDGHDKHAKERDNKFKVLYYGKYTPLHGTRYVIEAAKILEPHKDIAFEIIGKGQTYAEDMKLAKRICIKNIEFTDWIEYSKLPEKIAEADVCLGGHFGKTDKAIRVIPNKVFQIIAMGKPVIVNSGPSIREAGFKDGINCMFCKIADPGSIAGSILALKNDPILESRISKGALGLYRNNFSEDRIAKRFIEKIRAI